jgi:hypothetical protein
MFSESPKIISMVFEFFAAIFFLRQTFPAEMSSKIIFRHSFVPTKYGDPPVLERR